MSQIRELASMHAQVVIDAETFCQWMDADRKTTWLEGVEAGIRLQQAKELNGNALPMTVKEVQEYTNLGETSIRNLIERGILKPLPFAKVLGINKVLIPRAQVEWLLTATEEKLEQRLRNHK